MFHRGSGSRCLLVALLATVVFAPATLGAAGPARSATCGWSRGFHSTDLSGPVRAFAVFDDGSGPALYVGGSFTSAGEAVANHIAKWDGTSWSPLTGPSGNGLNDGVGALAVYDDGSGPALYVGGWFTSAGGVTANRIAKWNGTAWSALFGPSGNGVNTAVFALAVYDDGSGPALHAGGFFTSAGGVTANYVAKWNGTAWSALSGPSGNGVNGTVYALAAYNDGTGPALYAGGYFTSAGGVIANYAAKWNGSAWSALSGPSGNGLNDAVGALAVYDDGSGPALYAGGDFTSAGGVTANRIAKWNGTDWSALSGPSGNGLTGAVYALAVYDDGSGTALYAGGGFFSAGGLLASRIAKWNGTAWFALSGPSNNGVNRGVSALAVYDDGSGPALFAGGNFTSAGGVTANNIATWNGAAWSALSWSSGNGVNGYVNALAIYDDGSGPALYAGGYFTSAGRVTANTVAKWNGTTWSALSGFFGDGTNNTVDALAVYDDGSGPALYAAGFFTAAGGAQARSIAKWDGTDWSALEGPAGNGVTGHVRALAVYDDGTGPALFAAGDFASAGGVTASRIAKWDGTAWSALSGPSGNGIGDLGVFALAVFDDGSGPALFAGGYFTSAGGVTANGIAKWNGAAWSALSGSSSAGVSGGVYALTVADDGTGPALYVGGYFNSAGDVTANHIARWNGSAWSALSGPSGNGVNHAVEAFAVFDDGSGPALFAGGYFTTAGGKPATNIAKWNGTAWSALSGPTGEGVDGSVSALAPYTARSSSALFVGGQFGTAGGLASVNIARWQCLRNRRRHGASELGVLAVPGESAVRRRLRKR